ncbi:MAG TPA: hypothetical protein VNK47_01635 [Candidatus Dormibacteraeota bacterium]|nr:hypothetical protein [Candidatus Dormibacteraeota bacterium]
MSVNSSNFQALFQKLLTIKLFGSAPPPVPFGKKPTAAGLAKLIAPGANALPKVFQDNYSTPLESGLPTLLTRLSFPGDLGVLEALTGAVYQQTQKANAPQLHRFLAVISDLYRSFLSKKRRTAADFPLVEAIPPLAIFQHSGADGPYTIPSDDTESLFGAPVGVVSLPAVYRDHPLLWTSLSHETGGHDVIHADSQLMPEMQAGVVAALGGPSTIGDPSSLNQTQLIALLWAYWLDEAAADIYGIMNVGPVFGHNLSVFFAALNAQASNSKTISLRTVSGFDPNDPEQSLDPHPTDLLRLSLAKGVIENLNGLSSASRAAYSADMDALIQICAPGATNIQVAGMMHLGAGTRVPIQGTFPLADMQKTAYNVGKFVATQSFSSLGDHSIQDIETWDDKDEQTAQSISAALKSGNTVVGLGDDAQLLAGANLALLDQPNLYNNVTSLLNDALDASFAEDPYWATPHADKAYLRNVSLNFKPRSPLSRRAKA